MLATVVLGIVLLYIVYKYLSPSKEMRQVLDKIPGPKTLPLIGNAHQLRVGHDYYKQLMEFATEYQPLTVMWLAYKPSVMYYTAEHAEVILNGMKHIDKSPDYNFLHPWLGTGLLTSTGDKWKSRRRMLTPTFHFNILHDFLVVFNKKSNILVEKLKSRADKGEQFNVFQDIALCALDIISETAMGKDINAQSADSEYVHAVYRMSNITDVRMRQPWLWPNFLFNLIGPGREHDEKLKILHDFTNTVIADRLKDFDSIKSEMIRQEMSGEIVSGLKDKKIRLAFLDMLIYMSDNLTKLSMEDIREEVDTFMFEGHDTTAAAMNWAVHLIGANPEVQTKVHDEIDAVFGQDNRDPTMEDLKELKYLECCIKETLRLFPSVPMFARNAGEDTQLGEYTVPKNTTVVLLTTALHRDPKVFPDPEAFIPERFLLENSKNRHPYSYVPFSAGPRNCIGQKFALLEEKTVLCHLFRKFNVKSCQTREELRPVNDLILRPEKGIVIEISDRK